MRRRECGLLQLPPFDFLVFIVFILLSFLTFFILSLQIFETVPSLNMLVVRVRVMFFFLTFTELFLLFLGLSTAAQRLHGCIVYSWDQLIVLRLVGLTEHHRSPLKSRGKHTEDAREMGRDCRDFWGRRDIIRASLL